MKKPEQITLDIKQVEALLERCRAALPPEDYEIIKAMADNGLCLSNNSATRRKIMPSMAVLPPEPEPVDTRVVDI